MFTWNEGVSFYKKGEKNFELRENKIQDIRV